MERVKVHLTSIFWHLIPKNLWNDIVTYFEDFRLHTLPLSSSYFSFIGMQMSGIYLTYMNNDCMIKECKVQLNIMK
jgi:hypothetical protein